VASTQGKTFFGGCGRNYNLGRSRSRAQKYTSHNTKQVELPKEGVADPHLPSASSFSLVVVVQQQPKVCSLSLSSLSVQMSLEGSFSRLPSDLLPICACLSVVVVVVVFVVVVPRGSHARTYPMSLSVRHYCCYCCYYCYCCYWLG